MTLATPEQHWEAIHAERARLLGDLETLTPEQWSAPSLCAAWTIEDVVAHLTAAASIGRWAWLRSIIGARFQPDVHNDRRLAEHRGATPAETLEKFRTVVDARIAPTGDLWAWLGEVIVHSADIRVPLGIFTPPAPDAVVTVAHGYARKDFAVNSHTAVKGLRLTATDSDFTTGDGPAVEGPTLDLVLAMAGRAAAIPRLHGEGVTSLEQRITA